MSSFITQSGIKDITELSISQSSKVLVDVGAAIGVVTEWMISANQSCDVYAFEPYELNFKVLKSKFDSCPQAKLFQLALSNHSKKMNFTVPSVKISHVDDNKGVPIGYSGAGYVIPASSPLCNSENSTMVQCGRLDDYGKEAIDIMKIDVQGHEWAVLEGAKGHLESGLISQIWFEFMGDNRIFEILLSNNYNIAETAYYRTTADISAIPSCFDIVSTNQNYNGTSISTLSRASAEPMSSDQYLKWFIGLRRSMTSLWTDLYAVPCL